MSDDTKRLDPEKSFHMTPDEFRRWGRETVDWIAGYMERVGELPVRSQVAPGEIRARLPASAPEQGEPFDAMLRDVDEHLLDGVTHWQSPDFFAYFPANASGPSILGELLSAGLGVQGMLWATSPACTELETLVMDWLVEMLGLPETFLSTSTGGGVIQDTASGAALCALIAARERATGFVTDKRGCHQQGEGEGEGEGEIRGSGRGTAGETLVAYTSTQAHSSIEKAVRIAGLGQENLRLIEVDENYALRPEALEAAIGQDLKAGRRPCFVSATVGTTSSHGLDPVRAMGEICRRHGVWLHVDAAMAGTAALCPEHRQMHDGLDLADSYCFNPHKWMFTNFDCDAFWVADRGALIKALSVLPEYLRNEATDSGAVIDYRDWQIPLGRRFRALKLWFVIRHYGVAGLRHHVRQHIGLAQRFAGWVDESDDFEIAAPVPLNLVCFRHLGGDAINQRLLDRLNDSGDLYLTHTKLGGRLTLRLSIGQTHTNADHVQRAWRKIQSTAQKLKRD
jgi:aromatic-L-amino-acid/L-tryptophan decarboxylase